MATVNFSGLLPTPTGLGTKYFLDADYSQATPVGMPVPSFPFLDEDDNTTVQFRQKYEQALVSYAPPNLKAPMPGTTTLYPFGDVNWSDGQAGVACFERTYGNIPAQRTVHGQSFRYPFQYLLLSGASITGDSDNLSYTGASYSIGTWPLTVDSTLVYDYFLDGQQDQYPLYQAPQLIQVGNVITLRGESYLGTNPVLTLAGGALVCADPQMLAEDDTYVNYKGARPGAPAAAHRRLHREHPWQHAQRGYRHRDRHRNGDRHRHGHGYRNRHGDGHRNRHGYRHGDRHRHRNVRKHREIHPEAGPRPSTSWAGGQTVNLHPRRHRDGLGSRHDDVHHQRRHPVQRRGHRPHHGHRHLRRAGRQQLRGAAARHVHRQRRQHVRVYRQRRRRCRRPSGRTPGSVAINTTVTFDVRERAGRSPVGCHDDVQRPTLSRRPT